MIETQDMSIIGNWSPKGNCSSLFFMFHLTSENSQAFFVRGG